jgi:hypothetical protein
MSSSSRGVGCYWLYPSVSARSLLVAAVLFAAGSCAQQPIGEFGADACGNGQDDDGDALIDCNDPDCWVFCPLRGGVEIGDAAVSNPTDASFDASRPAADGGKPMQLDDDAGTPGLDASADDDAGSSPVCSCAPNEMCVDGECRPAASPSIEGMYTLSVKSALVPLGPSADRCFDYTAAACLTRILGLCDCERPDPYVVIKLNSDVLMKATTASVRDTVNPQWTDAPKVTIELKPTDALTFLVFDSDGIGQDPQIFSCMPDLSTLEQSIDAISCNPKPGTTVMAAAGASFFITVEITKVAPDAAMP